MKGINRKFADNKTTLKSYEIIEVIEAGISLKGWEVKAIRSNKVQLKESLVKFNNHEAYLMNACITPSIKDSLSYQQYKNRDRKLLIKKKDLIRIRGLWKIKGITIIPKDMHLRGPWIKLSIALAKGKKKFDKRQEEKRKEWNIQKNRLLKIKTIGM